MCTLALATVLIITANTSFAQGMSVNATGAAANASAMLDVASTSKGVLVPRMTGAQKWAISSPATGLMIFQTDSTSGFYYYTGSAWSAVGGSSLPSGSAGTVLYNNGSSWVSSGTGSNGQFLSLISGVPTWITLPFYYISALSGANGTVSPVGISALIPGASLVYTLTPSTGYHVDTVKVDGSSVGAVNTYTFTSVSAVHTISATFAINTYSIVASSGANGTVTPSGTTTVNYGSSPVYTITPSSGYYVSGVTVDGACIGQLTSDTFSFVTANHTISATFSTLGVGMSYGGGVIAYILQSCDPGYSSTTVHGLIAAPSDQSSGIQWYNGSFTYTTAGGAAIGTGQANTTAIVAHQGSGSYAASLCDNLTLGGYSDWYLPSLDELNKLYLNRIAIGGFASAGYWSSSEYPSPFVNNLAFNQFFFNGTTGLNSKAATYCVRAVRSF